MKILAIRGCNLASLAGEFEIDLAHGALGGAGVFAIVGNTGAGKSTLLDALCVALFDRTPRLTNHSRVQVGRGEDDPALLGAQDVRTLLRRGAGQGWAEVDFESGDSTRYRARWSVRRARGQADGNMLAAQVSLTALDGGHKLGGTKTETLAEIHRRLGLTFDQFRRSALLAQGDFAAFLRADGKDRSELLERMTGTSIYTRLSVAAHLRASLAEQSLSAGRAAAAGIPVLDTGAREGAEADRELANAARAAARARHASAEAAARWLAERAALGAALSAAESEHASAASALAGASVARDELATRRRAESLRPAWDEAARRDRELSSSVAELASASAALASSEGAERGLSTQREELAALHTPILAARIAAQLVERPARRAGAVSSALASALASGRAAHADALWLMAHPSLSPLVAAWPDLDAKFAQCASVADALAALDRSHREHARSRDQLVAARAVLVADHQAAVARHGEAQRKADAFQKRRGLSLDAARRAEDEARTRLTDVERLVALGTAARAAHGMCTEIDARISSLAAAGTTDAAARTSLETSRATAVAIRTEREHALAELRKAAGYDHARAELVDGEPCPLCGAEAHPWRDRGSFHAAVTSARARLDAATTDLDRSTSALADLAARSTQRALEQATLARSRTSSAADATTSSARWAEQLSALGELSLIRDPLDPAAEPYAADLVTAARRRLEDAKSTRSQTEAATKAAAEAQAEVQLCQTHVDTASSRLADLDRKTGDLAATLSRITGERAGRLERLHDLASSVSSAHARWRGNEDGAVLEGKALDEARAWMAELAAAWRARCERVADAEASLATVLAFLDVDERAAVAAVAEHAGRRVAAERRRVEAGAQFAAATSALDAARGEAGFAAGELAALLAAPSARVDELASLQSRLGRAVELARAVLGERRARLEAHAATEPPALDDGARIAELAAQLVAAEDHAARAAAVLAADDDGRVRRASALALLATAEAGADVDRILGEVIGSHDGKKFRSFAQSLTLDGLLSVANGHLEELAPRYQLERVPNHDLELQVIDRDLGDEVRSVQSLSGGESFLVSLALALGLSSMSAHDVRVRTLLIDEGFGTLDPATLDSALSVLDALQARGRQVGVISHVPQLVERVGAHVRVVQRGGGRSEVIVA